VGRIFVTGASGFVGRHLIDRVARDGIDAEASSADVRREEALRAELEHAAPDAVVHLAATASVSQAWGASSEAWSVNAWGTLTVVRAMRRAAPRARLLLPSTGEVYGSVPEGEQPIAEDRPVAPLSPYAQTKAAAELAVLGSGLDIVVARSFNHIGPGQDERFAVASFAAQIARVEQGYSEPVLRVGNLAARRDFTDVRDVVEAYARLLATPEAGGVVNVASGRAVSLEEVLDRLLDMAARPIKVVVDPERLRPSDIPVLSGNAGRLSALTGWEPERDLDSTLSDIMRDARARAEVPL
jgi:GDP-4-dehydro-6-deoxy-D-mannose reductase